MKKRMIFSVLMLGVVSQTGQVLLLRELLMAFQGNELSIGIILAAWMIWVGLGSFLGVILVSRFKVAEGFLKASAAAMLVILPATIFLVRNLRGFFNILPGAYPSLFDISLASFLVLAPACILLGIQFVLLARFWRQKHKVRDTSFAGKTYLGEAVGNMLGGIIFTFVMVHYLNSFQSAILVTVLMLIAFNLISLKSKKGLKLKFARISLVFIVLLVLLLLASPLSGKLDDLAYRIQWQDFTPYHNLVGTHQSKHGVISIAERDGQYSFFQSGHLIFSAAGPKTLTPGLEEQDAVIFSHFSMLQHKNPKKILLIGGGLRGTLSEIAKYPVEKIDYIELDEVLTSAALAYLPRATVDTLKDSRIETIHTDGRLFVKTTAKKYDLVIVDIPDPSTAVINRYYTKEFFEEVKDILYSDGVMVSGAVSTPDMRGVAVANRNATIYHTLEGVFPRVLVAGQRFIFYLASKNSEQITVDALTLQKRFTQRNIKTEDFSPHHFQPLLQRSQLHRINWIVRSHGRKPDAYIEGPSPGPLNPGSIQIQEKRQKKLKPVDSRYFINYDFKPIGYYYTLMFWEELTRAGGETFKGMLRFNFWWLFPFLFLPLFLVFLLRIFLSRSRKKLDIRLAVLFATFTTGFSTMALQIALIFSFQGIYGFVYEMVGMIIAIFMCGLALGTYLSNRYVKNKSSLRILAFVQIAITFFAVLIALALPAIGRINFPPLIFALFSILTFVAGLINGLDFPLAVACCTAFSRRAERSTGIIYGLELFGACIGAVLASIIVIPVAGIIACCFLAAFSGLSAFLTILIARSSYA